MLSNLGLDLALGLVLELEVDALLLVVDGGLDLALRLQGGDDMLVLPSNLVRQTAQDAELAVRLRMKDENRFRDWLKNIWLDTWLLPEQWAIQ